jgi:hypothetical protein
MLTSDKKLVALAINQMSLSQIHDNPVKEIVRKDKLSESDRSALVDFITPSLNKKQPSMSDMKKDLLNLIGYPRESISYGNTLTANEVRAIYNYFKDYVMGSSDGKKKK